MLENKATAYLLQTKTAENAPDTRQDDDGVLTVRLGILTK